MEVVWWLGLTAYIALLIWLRLPMLTAYGQEFDEGLFLMTARIARAGYPLYEAIFTDAEPGLPLLLAGTFHWLGDSLGAGRATMVFLMGFSLIGATACSRALYGRVGAVITLFILSTSPNFVQESALVLRDLPATGFAFWALTAALYYERRPRGWLAALAGGLISLSLLTKILYPFMLFLLLILLAWPHMRQRRPDFKRLLQSWGLFCLGGLVPVAIMLLWLDPIPLFEQTILFRLASRSAYPDHTPPANLNLMWRYLAPIRLWLPLAAFGALRVAWSGQGLVWLPVAMLGLTVLMLAPQAPLHIHALIALVPTLALLATFGLLELFNLLRDQPLNRLDRQIGTGLGILSVIVGLSGLVLWGWSAPKLRPFVPDNPPIEAIKLIQQAAPPGGTVLTDDQMIVFYAGRRSHPWLVNTSIMRLKTQSVTVDELISLTDDMGEQVVWTSTRFPAPYKDWLRENYWLHWTQDGLNTLFLGRKWPVVARGLATFEGGIGLMRADVSRVQGIPGDWLQIDTVWTAARPVSDNYTIFSQLLNVQSRLVAQMDRPPLLGLFPTSQWPAPTPQGIGDRFFVPMPEDLPAGEYRLIMGLYHSETLERLAVLETQSDSLGDAVLVDTVRWPLETTQ